MSEDNTTVETIEANEVVKPEHIAEVRGRIHHLKAQIAENYYELAEKLFEVYNNRYYMTWEYTSFDDYCSKELGFKKRKALYLISIFEKFNKDLGIDRERICHIDWSKMKELVPIATEENVNDLIDKAETMSLVDITAEAKKIRAQQEGREVVEADDPTTEDTSGPAEQVTRKAFRLYPAQLENILAALERAEDLSGSSKEGHNLDMICTEFNSTYAEYEEGGVAQRIQFHVDSLNRLYPGANVTLNPDADFDPDKTKSTSGSTDESVDFGQGSEASATSEAAVA